eukprot:1230817-Lingulodinium_polyedra.AAC.1
MWQPCERLIEECDTDPISPDAKLPRPRNSRSSDRLESPEKLSRPQKRRRRMLRLATARANEARSPEPLPDCEKLDRIEFMVAS